ncbi:MAG: N-glycosylase/DNA lyase [Candidatus Hadarchaeia archaeon]
MQDLISRLNDLKSNEVGGEVEERMAEFKEVGKSSERRWFSELCFCILTANCSAELAIEIQNDLGAGGFVELSFEELRDRLRNMGYRFYRVRARYIVKAREYAGKIKSIITDFSTPADARGWLVENVKGVGYKEGSHFLRNVGYEELAILDRHILRILNKYDVIDKIPNTLTRSRYLSIEKNAKEVSAEIDLSPGELDLYMWYMATGKVLK